MNNSISGGLGARLAARFPEREIFLRSRGKVRFIKLSPRVQIAAVAVALTVLLLWVAAMTVLTLGHFANRAEAFGLHERETRLSAYRGELNATVESLKKRQDFIEEMVSSLPADAGLDANPAAGTGAPEDKALTRIGAAMPEAAALARIEARQFALVDRLTRFANHRADSAAAAIRKLGLDPHRMADSADDARGGPFEQLSTERNGSLHPRFERFGLAFERMEAMERGLEGIPQVLPASLSMISSGFGYRRDPFNDHAAFHSGLDFRGPIGSPIYAAAAGKVTFQGVRNGYGNVVEISHGNGLVTRYAHMSAFHTRPGQDVDAGNIIGAIGSTGRSTGPHLHFEVLVNGRAVNPRPFLEAASHVREEVRFRNAERQ